MIQIRLTIMRQRSSIPVKEQRPSQCLGQTLLLTRFSLFRVTKSVFHAESLEYTHKNAYSSGEKDTGGGEMKLTKLELIIWRLLLEAAHPMSVAEITERLPCRYIPEPVVLLAVECLIHKKVLVEAGVHQSFTDGGSSRTIVYALSQMAIDCERKK